VVELKVMAGSSLGVKMLLSESGNEGELIQKLLSKATQTQSGQFAFCLGQLGRFLAQLIPLVELIESCLHQELQMER